MFQYYCRILDKYKQPITAFALFVDANKNFHPKHYQQEFLGTKLYYEFNTCKIIDLDDTELEASDNPFAMAVLTAKLALTSPKTSSFLTLNTAWQNGCSASRYRELKYEK